MDLDELEAFRRSRISDLADKLEGKAALGRSLGYKDGAYIGQMIRGDRPITEKTIAQIESLPGCDGWFSATVPALLPKSTGSIVVPLLSAVASMGYGSEMQGEDAVTGALTLSPSWVTDRVKPTKVESLRFIHGYGDSMSPTFNSGDVLLVDTGVRDANIDGVYVLKAHARLFVKRVRQRLDGSFEVSSDNPGHKTVDTLNGDQDVEVLGRVVWAWNGRKI